MPLDRTRLAARLGWTVLVVAIVCAAAALAAGPGYRLSWWGLGPGIAIVRWAGTAAIAVIVVGILAAILAQQARAARARRIAALGTAVALATALPPALMYERAQSLPRIHDVSTDTEHPPEFVAVLPLRQGARNGTTYPAATAAAQRAGYADIEPLVLPLSPARAFAAAEAAARSMRGWTIVDASAGDGRIEATDTTLLFGFTDDVVIRVSPDARGSRIDVRSLSRVGGVDFGTNAKRVRAYLARLAAQAAAP